MDAVTPSRRLLFDVVYMIDFLGIRVRKVTHLMDGLERYQSTHNVS